MASNKLRRVRELFDRIARVAAAEEWADDLNPAQRTALAYIARANRFSRAPSNVADYLCATRGTTSQTLKALERKGFVEQHRSIEDKRSISYEVTQKGREVISMSSSIDAALGNLKSSDMVTLTHLLEVTGRSLLEQKGLRTFGLCRECRHHLQTEKGLACGLLDVPLTESDANELCFEHDPLPERVSIA